MSRTTIALAALALGFVNSASATRVLEQPEDAYELLLGEVVLPSTAAGYITFKACADCPTQSLGVGEATRYFVQKLQVSFADFSVAADGYRAAPGGNESTGVYVFYDVESGRVNRLVVSPFGE